MDQQGSQVDVASLADAQQRGLATRGVLARHKAQPCGKLSAIFEVAGIAHSGDHRSRSQWSNARNLLKPLTGFVTSMPGLDLDLNLIDLLIKHLQVLEQSINKDSKHTRQIVGCIFNQRRHTLPDVANALRNN